MVTGTKASIEVAKTLIEVSIITHLSLEIDDDINSRELSQMNP